MVSSFLITLLCRASLTSALTTDNGEWEEPAMTQLEIGHHPFIRFKTSEEFIATTPSMICEGTYQSDGQHYQFRPVTAFQSNHADINKLAEALDPEAGRKMQEGYSRALEPFDADYDASTGYLRMHYKVNGEMQTFSLLSYTAGDDQLPWTVAEDARSMVGLWKMIEPFPERLDSKTRFRIGGLEGLQQFFEEAQASDNAQFAMIDLRSDKSYRIHSQLGTWRKEGTVLVLEYMGKATRLGISDDGTKILSQGKPLYIRA